MTAYDYLANVSPELAQVMNQLECGFRTGQVSLSHKQTSVFNRHADVLTAATQYPLISPKYATFKAVCHIMFNINRLLTDI